MAEFPRVSLAVHCIRHSPVDRKVARSFEFPRSGSRKATCDAPSIVMVRGPRRTENAQKQKGSGGAGLTHCGELSCSYGIDVTRPPIAGKPERKSPTTSAERYIAVQKVQK
jgi:hypothetical protein